MKKIISYLLSLSLGFLGGFLFLHFFSFNYFIRFLIEESPAIAPIEIIETREVIIRENEAIVSAIKEVQRAIVGIKIPDRTDSSGLIVSSDGLVVALSTLVPVRSSPAFYINGQIVSYEIQKRDKVKNLALVKVEGEGLPTLEFANQEELMVGEKVFLVGTIFDDEGKPQKSVNQGIIKRIEDGLIVTNIKEEERLAGSTLFNLEGKILGINLIGTKGEVLTISAPTIREFIEL